MLDKLEGICGNERETGNHGRTREAVRICKEYLFSREKKVVDMFMELYDEQKVLRLMWKAKSMRLKMLPR